VRKNLSALVITWNEESNLPECLSSLAFADEIVVVDSGSTDRTPEIARQAGAALYDHPWEGYGPQKNFGMEQASGDWILILDADERVTAELRAEIDRVVTADALSPAAWSIPRKNHLYGRWLAHGGAYPDRQIRLFRRGKARYNDVDVHENLIVDGAVGELASPMLHFSEKNVTQWIARMNRYTTLSARVKLRSGWRGKVGALDLLLRPLNTFFKFYVRKRGFLDGVPGLVWAAMGGVYTLFKYVKLYEEGIGVTDRTGEGTPPVPPKGGPPGRTG